MLECKGDDVSDDVSDGVSLLTLTCVAAGVGSDELEQHIARALDISAERVTVMDVDDGTAQFIVDVDVDLVEPGVEGDGTCLLSAEDVVRALNGLVGEGGAKEGWLGAAAECVVAEMEEEVLIDEEDALNMWRDMGEEERTSHLAAFPSPDGDLVRPAHEVVYAPDSTSSSTLSTASASSSASASAAAPGGWVSATQLQLKRDPGLLTFDNVARVDVAHLDAVSWAEPIVITGVAVPVDGGHLARAELLERFGDAEVRTGNRSTLAENGFVNSKPMALREALGPGGGAGAGAAAVVGVGSGIGSGSSSGSADLECGRIVFSPVKELPASFRRDLASIVDAFPCEHEAQGRERVRKKFTLCLGREGFGIGFHRHNAAMFLLAIGRKKWYMGPQSTEDDTPTHPGFYTHKSSHKCIQHPGEILYVPDQWYHEIFNLDVFTAGVQALPDEEAEA
jgi:hypothetical protein